jgi:pilus assembly protein CpaC
MDSRHLALPRTLKWLVAALAVAAAHVAHAQTGFDLPGVPEASAPMPPLGVSPLPNAPLPAAPLPGGLPAGSLGSGPSIPAQPARPMPILPAAPLPDGLPAGSLGSGPSVPTQPGRPLPNGPTAEELNPVNFKVAGPQQKLELVVNSSRILTVDHPIPKAQLNNPDIARLTPISQNQIQIFALKPGVTTVNIWDADDRVSTIDVMIYGDARELQMLINGQFPTANVRVLPLASSVLITGTVPKAEMVSRITRIAEDYYGKVINNMQVEGVQQVLLHVKVMEVSRTKLRRLGFDWANINGNDFVTSSVSGILSATSVSNGGVVAGTGDTIRFGIVDGSNAFFGFLNALRQNNMVKVLAEPTLVTVSGRPASFNVGGEFPILIPSGLGTVSVQYREFGTRVDFVPIVLGNGQIRLETRPSVSEIDDSRGVTINGTTVPGLRTRWVDTGVEMRAGQTLALAGLIQQREEAESRAIPVLGEMPWLGAAFRRVQNTTNEIELLIMVRPELVDPLDCHEVPPCGPGMFTNSPRDLDLFARGYLETPKCCTDGSCPDCRAGMGPNSPYGPMPGGGQYGPPSNVPPGAVPVPGAVPAAGANYSAARANSPAGRQVLNSGKANVQNVPYSGQGSTNYVNRTASAAPSYGASAPAPVVTEPAFIGPRGYDVIEYKK